MSGLYCGPAPLPPDIWARWNTDPALLLALALLAFLIGRSRPGAAALAVLLIAFVSPLCALSAALFSARVVHHVLLVAVAAPLLAIVFNARFRPRATCPVALPFALSTLLLWGWHLPAGYDLALANVAVYWSMQLSLLVSATWFWRSLLAPDRSPVDALLFTGAGFWQMGLLGAILTFAPRPLYQAHALAPLEWGLSPLADQQLGGLLMWVPAGLPYALIALHVARRGWGLLKARPA